MSWNSFGWWCWGIIVYRTPLGSFRTTVLAGHSLRGVERQTLRPYILDLMIPSLLIHNCHNCGWKGTFRFQPNFSKSLSENGLQQLRHQSLSSHEMMIWQQTNNTATLWNACAMHQSWIWCYVPWIWATWHCSLTQQHRPHSERHLLWFMAIPRSPVEVL